MKNICVFIIFTTLLLSANWAVGLMTSTSYIIPAEVMGSAGGAVASTSYGVFGSLSGLNLGIRNSNTYLIREGFIPSAYPVLAVLVTSISPFSGYNTGVIDITDLAGAGFLAGASVRLKKSGQADIVANDVIVASSRKIICKFDLTGKATGLWDVVVINPDNKSGTLPSGFNIKTWASLHQVVNYPNPFDPRLGPTTIIYQLSADTNTSVLIFNISRELIFRWDFVSGSNGGRAGDNSVIWEGYSAFRELAANGVYFVQVLDKSSGKILAKGKIAVSK